MLAGDAPQAFLVAEVVVQQSLGDLRALRDVAHRRAVESTFGEEADRRLQDRIARVGEGIDRLQLGHRR